MSLKTKISPKIVSLTFGVLILSFLIAFYVFSWDEPTLAPPQANVAFPLNVGSTSQTKVGGLILNSGEAPNALIINYNFLKLAETIAIVPADCDNNPVGTELGRMILDTVNNRLYICGTAGWSFINL